MKAFEIFSWQPPGWPEPHPCVIISNPSRVENKPDVEVLLCSTQRATRKAETHEFILDQGDGLDWPTLCKCDLIYAVAKSKLGSKRGEVAKQRRAPLLKVVIASHAWAEVIAGAN